MTVLYEPRRSDAQQLATMIGGDVRTVPAGPDLVQVLGERRGEQLLLLGPGVELAEAMNIAGAYRVSRPELGVLLIRGRMDMNVLSEAIRAGVREVVPANDSAVLVQACNRSLALSRQMRPTGAVGAGDRSEGRVVTVFAAKGGCGKTTVATNLAVALADGGRRRVCLIDLDLAFGDVAIMMQIAPERSIADAVDFGDRIDEAALRAVLTPYAPGVDTLLAPAGPAEAERVTGELVASLLRLAAGLFDYLVIDTPPQFTDQVLAALDVSHAHVLLTTPDMPALKNLRITLDTFDLLDLPREHRLIVLNRSDAKVGLTAADIERVIRVPIAAHIPSSRDVPVSINRGIPIVADDPHHPVSRSIREFAVARLAGVPAAERGARGLRGLLSRGGGRR